MSRGPAGRWLRHFAQSLGCLCRACPSPLLLLQALQKWELAFLVSLYLFSRICPNNEALPEFLKKKNERGTIHGIIK